MKIGENIKRIRTAKKLSQKEVISVANLDSAQYSRIENSKTDPTVTTLEKIAKALGVSLSDLFASTDELKEINSYDKSIMEKVALLEALKRK
jgi:transcriptional regulator with XRE-family HTH domain